jgi:hypothetical protein
MGLFRLVFAFLSIRSFHAIRSAPVSTTSLVARRICVCPIFPQPPGIGKKISGASSTNAACCSERKHQISEPPCLRGQRSKFPASCTKSRQSRVRVLFHAQGNPARICCGHVAIPIRQREYRISPEAAFQVARGRLSGPGCGSLVSPGNPNHYIKAECFAVPTAPSTAFYSQYCDPSFKYPTCINLRGNAGRNILIGPGLVNLDFSLAKNTRVGESLNAQFRAEAFNIFNRANYQVPPTH